MTTPPHRGFEERLLAELLSHVHGEPIAFRRSPRLRPRTLVLGLAVAAAALAAVAVLPAGGSTQRTAGDTRLGRLLGPAPASASAVARRALRKLDSTDDVILHSYADPSVAQPPLPTPPVRAGGPIVMRSEDWIDQLTGDSRSIVQAPPSYDVEEVGARPVRDGDHTRMEMRSVDHTQGFYCDYGYPTTGSGPVPEAQIARRELARGNLREDGHERLDGKDAIRLVGRGSQYGEMTDFRMWVDATSYLPIKLSWKDGDRVVARLFEWLPRTPETVASLWPTVPGTMPLRCPGMDPTGTRPTPSPGANAAPADTTSHAARIRRHKASRHR